MNNANRNSNELPKLLAVAVVAGAASPAAAWQIETPMSQGCHERITAEALREVGYAAPPSELSDEDARWPAALEFDVSKYDANVYAWSLVMGVRSPDLLGASLMNPLELAKVHNAAIGQGDHCLRAAVYDGAEGDKAALDDCRRTIEHYYWEAAGKLDDGGRADPAERGALRVHTPYQGAVEYPVSRFYAAAGRALHAVQDSFTHTFRTADYRRVLHVFNWVEQVKGTLDEARDGHNHESAMDHCDGGDPEGDARVAAAVRASAELLAALTRPGTRAERQARLERFFADWFEYQPGCELGNEYCGHPMYRWMVQNGKTDAHLTGRAALGCSTAGAGSSAFPLMIAALFVAAVARRRAGR
jgi:hypothetical protein